MLRSASPSDPPTWLVALTSAEATPASPGSTPRVAMSDDPVFVTSAGRPRSRHNLRQDVVDAVVAHANTLVEERGLQPLPLGITAHKLRHTFASILVAIGKDPTHVMQQFGHTDPVVHAPGLRAHDAPQRGRAWAAEGARRRLVWAANGQRARDSALRGPRVGDT